jgi:hypothetical protein
MDDNETLSSKQATPALSTKRTRFRRTSMVLLAVLILYVIGAYILVPALWIGYAHRHPAFDDVPRLTLTGDDHPGGPINVALIGTESQLKRIMLAAKWYPADPLTLRSCLEIAEATVLKRPYDDAPVSSLYLWGRKEDLAFEQPVGTDPRKRHHVRFWRSPRAAPDGRPIWVGAAIFDERVGLSHTTGQITHRTAPDVDAERDYLFHDLEQTGDLSEFYVVDGFHKTLKGVNGGGDPWHTDGKLYAGVITKSLP